MSKLTQAEWRGLEYANQQAEKVERAKKATQVRVPLDFTPHRPGDIVDFHDRQEVKQAVLVGSDRAGNAILFDAAGYLHFAKYEEKSFRCFLPLSAKKANGYDKPARSVA